MKKKIVLAAILLCIWGGSMAFANTASNKVSVFFNAVEVKDDGILLDGKTFLPLRELANSFQALLVWDDRNKSAKLFKPNVHMFVYQGNTPFGMVKRGTYKFNVFAQIDELKTDITAVKVSIIDPKNNEKVIQTKSVDRKTDNFWFVTEELDYRFTVSGKYIIRFYMRTPDEEWTAVSDKVITSQ